MTQARLVIDDKDEFNLDNLMEFGEDVRVINGRFNKRPIKIHKWGDLMYGEAIDCVRSVTGEWQVVRVRGR